jgi:predicted phosphodiesterase
VILGILSDSHGRTRRTARAVRLLKGLGADALVHCGDLGNEAVLDELVGLPAWFVWGNTDSAGPLLRAYARVLGLPVPETVPLRLELAGRSIAIFHGHEPHFTGLVRLIRLERIAEFEASLETLVRGSPLAAANPAERGSETGAPPQQSPAVACDYILFGHAHRASDVRVGRVRLVNPGALHRARPATVATLDLKRDDVKFWEVDDGAGEGNPPRRFMPQ